MKYSLRSLMIAVVVIPPLLAGGAWMLIPRSVPVSRGTLVDEVMFLQSVMEPFPSDIRAEMENCFIVGELASHHKELLAQANRSGVPTHFLPGTQRTPTGTQYVFWCEGKDPAINGNAWVVVIVDGNPARIAHTWVDIANR